MNYQNQQSIPNFCVPNAKKQPIAIINGKIVMKDRVVIGIDETKALEAVAKHIPTLSDKMLKLGGAVHPGLCPCGF